MSHKISEVSDWISALPQEILEKIQVGQSLMQSEVFIILFAPFSASFREKEHGHHRLFTISIPMGNMVVSLCYFFSRSHILSHIIFILN